MKRYEIYRFSVDEKNLTISLRQIKIHFSDYKRIEFSDYGDTIFLVKE